MSFSSILRTLNSLLWGPPLLVLLFGTHLFLTFRLRFIQRHIWQGIKVSFSKKKNKGVGDISQFGALATALAATIGTGNIVGVATALTLGGPGAIFWMWLTGVFGIATKYAEALLSVKYRVKAKDGTMLGGPMFALEKGLGQKWLAVFFSIFTAIAAFGIGNMVQANSISSLVHDTFHIKPELSGLIMACLTFIVIIGGIRSIATACEGLVPFMAITYIGGCLYILAVNHSLIGSALVLITKTAFSAKALGGGFAGTGVALAMRYGVARGLFSNESGLGSAPIVAAAAKTKTPIDQALVSMTGTFWDTVIICALSGLVLVTSILKQPAIASLNGALLTKAAFATIPGIGPLILTIGLLTFVFSTILGWSYYGEKAVEYLFGLKAIKPYRYLWVIAVYLGSVSALPLVWDFADASNALMAIPNIISLLLLNKVIVAETKKHLWNGLAKK